MIDAQLQQELLDEIEDTLAIDGFVGLYDFSWSLRGLKRGVPEADFPAICQAAYDEFRKRHALKLVWLNWPVGEISKAAIELADDSTPLVFDVDRQSEERAPFLALVPSAPASARA